MSFTQEDLEEFKVEAIELLDTAEKSLLALDQGADFKSSFDSVFRGFHNLKGAAGMMELTEIQAHTHELETILMSFKNQTAIPSEYISFFFRGIDATRSLLEGNKIEFDYTLIASEPSPGPAPVSSQEEAFVSDLPESAIEEFLVECEEIVERVSKNLQAIERNQYDRELVDGLYRDVHSLKGSSYLFSFGLLGDIAHAMESSLEKVRNETHLPTPQLLNCLFKSLEVIEGIISKIRAKVSDAGFAPVVPVLTKALGLAADKLSPVVSEVVVKESVPVKVTAPPVVKIPEQVLSSSKEKEASSELSSIRVPVSLLDNLMTLMGEMVLVRNQVLQFSNTSEDLEFLSMSKRLNVVTNEIQGEMMKTRMQPIGNVLNKFNRVVRDLSGDLKKNITLNLNGAETELDKSLLEAIKDPLTHIIRNSCDHGIELPEIRKQNGKPESGTIIVKAYHEGGQVVVEISDDGKGLHKDQLLNKAIEKNVITPSDASKLSDKEIFNLIFAPGFSTAAQVTNVSGRGVGMDVVRTNIEKIGGTIVLSSEAGVGTNIKLKIPLTLAIVPALIVKCGGGSFAVPQVKLEELVRIDQSSDSRIEVLHGSPVFRLRGRILPLVDLNQVLGLGTPRNISNTGIFNVAVLNGEHCSFGVIIDEILDTADIVVKPINRLLKSLQVFSGGTVLGDGSIALIFDVLGISKVTKVGLSKKSNHDFDMESFEKEKMAREIQDFLVVKLNSPTKHALSLSYVHRLEEFKLSDIELSGDQKVIRYGDKILPILFANDELGYGKSVAQGEKLSVVVIHKAGQFYGIAVDEIVDTFSTAVEMDPCIKQHPGIFGNLNTKEELIVLIDPFEIIHNAFFDNEQVEEVSSRHNIQGSGRILLVEDTVFFRRTVKSLLERRGYEVTTANDGQEALDILNKESVPFDLIISDIEMPKVNGFQLAINVRNHPVHSAVPLIALSSRADKDYKSEGMKSGFDIYLEKLKPNVLLAAISELAQKTGKAA
jgi:two-component system chemotaxis sensor kinase CheA